MSENPAAAIHGKTADHAPPHAAVPPVARELRADLERSLRTRHYGHGKLLFQIEDSSKIAAAKVWRRLKRRPYAGIAAATAFGFTVASMTGVGELAIAALCGYGAYQVLRRGEPAGEAVEEMVRDVCKMG
jgi:hypothetical protein